MKFEDLTQWDINLIKSNGANMLAFTRCNDRYEAIAECTLSCIYAKGYKLDPYPNHFVKVLADKLKPSYGYGSSRTEMSVEDVIKAIFTFMDDQKIGIFKDESREATWTQPNDSWYHRPPNYKKPWVI